MKFSSRYLLFCILVCACLSLSSQGHSTLLDIDDPQTKVLWDSLIAFNEANQYYEAIPLLHRIILQSKTAGEKEALAYAYENLAELKQLKGELILAKEYGLKASELLLELEHWDEYATRLRRLSNISSQQGEEDIALAYLNQIRNIQHKTNSEKTILQLYADLGNLYFKLNEFDSTYHYRKLNVESVSESDTVLSNKANIAMAVTLININDYDKAMEYAQRALEFTNPKKYPLAYGTTIARLGYIENFRGNYRSAEKYLNDAITWLKNIKHSDFYVSYYSIIAASIYTSLGEYEKAKEMMALAKPLLYKQDLRSILDFDIISWKLAIANKDKTRSLSYFHKLNENKNVKILFHEAELMKLRSQHFELVNDTKNALYYLDKYAQVKDSLRSILNVKAIQNLEIKYKTEQKDAELAQASNRIRLQKNGIFGGGAMLFALLTLLYFNNKNKNKISNQNTIISKSLEEKEILLKEIHHRVKNNLQVISSLLSIQSRGIHDDKAKEAILESKTRVHSMSLIHQNLYKKDNLTGVRIDRYLGTLTKDLLDTYNISEGKIAIDQQIEPLKLDVDSVIPLGLIINELMSNALKYAFPENRDGKIVVFLKEQGECLVLQVSDNGVGMKENQRGSNDNSFGHTLIRAFKSRLDAKIDIQSTEGTTIKLTINNYKKVA